MPMSASNPKKTLEKSPAPNKVIRIVGAREHNLQNVSLQLPRDSMIVITGLSGSGKSSLAFDTLYAEGQRRYVESLSAYARQFLEVMQKPDVDQIDGLSPAISIEQKTTSRNPRSTVGTVTEIYDYMRLLYARAGVPYSPATGLPIESQTVTQMVDRALSLPQGARYYLLAPFVRGRKGEYRKELAELQRRGFQRVRIDGEFHDMEALPVLDKNRKHEIDVVVDRLVIGPELGERLADSLETALALSDGLALMLPAPQDKASAPQDKAKPAAKSDAKPAAKSAAKSEVVTFSAKFACPVSGFTLEEVEPRLFSFNNPRGACASCDGLGMEFFIDARAIVPNADLSLKEGALAPWGRSPSIWQVQTLEALSRHYNINVNTPWRQLEKAQRELFLHGSGEERIRFRYREGARAFEVTKRFEGIIPNLERRYRETDSAWAREDIEKYQSIAPCKACNGYRLKPDALTVKLGGRHIGEVAALSIADAKAWFAALPKDLNARQKQIAAPILKEIGERLHFLDNVGLDYLTLARAAGTLSGGESQRIRLASQIGSGLTGVLYVLDEPSIGLHQRDNVRLLRSLQRLRDLGNSVIVVEHDSEAIAAADYVVDMGPGAGRHGGQVVASGAPPLIARHKTSLTGQYLSGRRQIPCPPTRRRAREKRYLRLEGAQGHNLKGLTLDLPLGCFICVTGVSGSGKSTLVIDTLYRALARHLHGSRTTPAAYEGLSGLEWLDKVIDIDQSPIGRTPRSNPATYTGLFSPVRDWFANLPQAKMRGYRPGRFSFNVRGGRCEACQGDGVLKIEMHFLPDVYVTCDNCRGQRYNRETLEVRFKDKSIADVLNMTVEEAREFFKAIPMIREKLDVMQRVGLDYIHLGQQATTLSGGEAQRIKLSKELSRRATGRTLYILDEPTTGLHYADVEKLLEVLHELVALGNTVLVIEHNLDVIKTADWVVDLGPEGGDGGGELVASGTPEELAKVARSYTGQYLAPVLARHRSSRAAPPRRAAPRRRA